jgi:hypothetical protein
MIEQRQLTIDEMDRLLTEAPDEERSWMLELSKKLNQTPYEIFKRYAFDWDGVVANGRPIYVAGVFFNGFRYELYTIVTSCVDVQLSLFKCAKRGLTRWIKDLPNIYATMQKSWVKNIEWTKRLGFKVCSETSDTITFVKTRE